jgi:DNA-binding response OmpR family regulator
VLAPLHHLDLEVAEAPGDLPSVENRHLVQHDVCGATPVGGEAQAAPDRAELGDGTELASMKERDEKLADPFRRTRRPACDLDLDSSGPARQLQLPQGLPTLQSPTQGDPAASEAVVGRVVVRRGEAPLLERLALQAGEQVGIAAQLHLPFDGGHEAMLMPAVEPGSAVESRSPDLHRIFTGGEPRRLCRPGIIVRMAKVLIVEDDEVIAKAMTTHLAAAGFDALYVAKGQTGLARLRFERPDVCVLDLMLPGLDGWQLIETARREGIGTPIVVVSARGSENDRVRALELGADDYLVKPFSMRELVARVRAAARRGVRAKPVTRGDPIEVEELFIDPHVVQAYVDGLSAELTPTEFRLLHALALEQGRVVTRDELMQRLWGRRQTRRDRTVDVFIRKLRDKVDRRAARHDFIHTRYGVGYRFEPVSKDGGAKASETSRESLAQL